MKFTLVTVFATLLSFGTLFSSVRAQYGLGHLGGGSFGVAFPGSGYYGGGAGGYLSSVTGGGRDPRANTGPVVFPAAPTDNGETSGVVVGASGFGFVPPNGQSGRYHSFFSFF